MTCEGSGRIQKGITGRKFTNGNQKGVVCVVQRHRNHTRKVATALSKQVAEGLQAQWEEYSFNLPAAREKELSFGPADLVVLGVPVYAGRVPNLLLPYIRDHIHGRRGAGGAGGAVWQPEL